MKLIYNKVYSGKHFLVYHAAKVERTFAFGMFSNPLTTKFTRSQASKGPLLSFFADVCENVPGFYVFLSR